jgi:hypothetical protein
MRFLWAFRCNPSRSPGVKKEKITTKSKKEEKARFVPELLLGKL